MKLLFRLLTAACLMMVFIGQVRAQGTSFTYQGHLTQSGLPANGLYDFQLGAWSASTNGSLQGTATVTNGVPVTNGLFTIDLNFGPEFTGVGLWLDIAVRTHGNGLYTEVYPRQNLTPAPYAIFAGSVAQAANASGFSGSFSGNVIGNQNSTSIVSLGGQLAGPVAAGTAVANQATSADTANTIVKRDGSGNFSAGTITATSFSGRGGGFTSLNAANFTSGILPASVLPASAAQLGSNQTFTGVNTFANRQIISPGNGTLTITNDGGIVPGILATGGNAPGHARFRNALEIWPGVPATNTGYLDVRATNGVQSIVLTGQTGAVAATAFSGIGSNITGATVTALGNSEITSAGGENGLSVDTNIYLNDNIVFLRNDQNHGLAYDGNDIINLLVDGPVLWGYTGGALGQLNGGANAALTWNSSGVGISNNLAVGGNLNLGGNLSVANLTAGGTLTASNTAGAADIQVHYPTNSSQITTVAGGQNYVLGYFANARPGPGYFVITAYADISGADANLVVSDVTSGSPVMLTQALITATGSGTVTMTYVLPIPQASSNQVFQLSIDSPILGRTCLCYNGTASIAGYNLTAMYFPRLND